MRKLLRPKQLWKIMARGRSRKADIYAAIKLMLDGKGQEAPASGIAVGWIALEHDGSGSPGSVRDVLTRTGE